MLAGVLGGDVAVDGVVDGLRLVLAGSQQQDAAGAFMNAADAQADGLTGHVVFAVEEAAVGLEWCFRSG